MMQATGGKADGEREETDEDADQKHNMTGARDRQLRQDAHTKHHCPFRRYYYLPSTPFCFPVCL